MEQVNVMDIKTQEQLDKLVKDRQNAVARRDEWAAKVKAHSLEIEALLNEAGAERATAGGWDVLVHSVVAWQTLDKHKVIKDLPIDEYPEVYSPDYSKLKTFLNGRAKLPVNDTRLVSKYTGFRTELKVTKPRKTTKRPVVRKTK